MGLKAESSGANIRHWGKTGDSGTDMESRAADERSEATVLVEGPPGRPTGENKRVKTGGPGV